MTSSWSACRRSWVIKLSSDDGRDQSGQGGANFVDNRPVWLLTNIPLAGLLAHISGGLWMCLLYKKLAHERTPMPLSILGWVAIVLVYLYAFTFRASLSVRSCSIWPSADWYGEGAFLIRAYGELGIGHGEPGAGDLPEASLTPTHFWRCRDSTGVRYGRGGRMLDWTTNDACQVSCLC